MARNTIAVCVVKMDENFQSDALKAITKRAAERGLNVEIFNSFDDLVNNDLHDKGEESIFELVDYRHLFGIIFFPEKIKSGRVNDNIFKYAKSHNIPLVAIDREIKGCISITFDYKKAFEDVVEHLITVHGCKSFYIMGGMRNNSFSDERIEAALKVIAKHGYSVPEENIGYGDFWEYPTRTEMKKFFESGRPLPDAFIAANDSMAMVICDELHNHGVRVPEDCIVTGFDGIEAEKYAYPRLTTAETDLERCGYIAVDSILGCETSGDGSRHVTVPFHTRFSQSCGCKPTNLSSVNGGLQELYNALTDMKLYNNMMSSMLTRMSATDNLVDMIKLVDRYRNYFTDYRDIYICLRRSVVMTDPELADKLSFPDDDQSLSSEEGADRQMVLLLENHLDHETQYPLEVFRLRDLLPNRNEILKEEKNLVFFPLHIQDGVYGYVATSIRPHEWEYRYYQMAYFTRNLSQAISYVLATIRIQQSNQELKNANKLLGDISETDYLTGLNNRRGFFARFDKIKKNPLYSHVAVASIDLNGLKRINDKYGHAEGDKAICRISDVLKKLMDGDCICARFGGDEFSLCRFGNSEDVGEDFKQRFDELMNEVNRTEKPEYLFSASFGLVTAPLSETDTLDKLLNKSDEKMYAEKAEFHRTHKEFEKRRADRR